MTLHGSTLIRGVIAGALGGGLLLAAGPVRAQVTAQPSAPVQLTQCNFDFFGGIGLYNREAHVDLVASLVDRKPVAAKLVGVTTEFFDEQGALVRKLDAAYSGTFQSGLVIERLRFGLGAVLAPVAVQRCFVSRVEFVDGSVWTVADHYAEVERPPAKCRVTVKDGSTFEAAWNGALCAAAREAWDAAHRVRTASNDHGG